MTSEDREKWSARLLLVLVGVVIGLFSGIAAEEAKNRRDAVIHGHAEWISGTQGSPVFKWKEIK